jgi:tetratricopeptide (TPR) repeat protein
MLVALGKPAEALGPFRASLAIRERLAGADPSNAGSQRDLSVAYIKIGDLLLNQGDLAGALRVFEDALAVRTRLVAINAENAVWQWDLAFALSKVATAQAARGEAADALEGLRKAREIVVELKEQFPDNSRLPNDLVRLDAEIAKLDRPSP